MLLLWNLAIEVVGQNWSSEAISLLLIDWEVGQVALSCHLSMDLLCQEMRGERCSDAWVPCFNVMALPAGRVQF